MNKTELLKSIRQQAKKVLPVFGQGDKIDKTTGAQVSGAIIEGEAKERQLWDTEYDDLQHLFRHQFPSVTKQLLGRRYNTVNKFSRFVLPNGMDQAADEILELLSDVASGWANTDSVLSATGCKNISQLSADPARSQRAGCALKEVNKTLAGLQGAVSGMTGLLGVAVDLPASVIFSLKTIYEIGHSYGFELDSSEDQKAVYFALSTMDLSLIAEKQAIFLVLRGLNASISKGDLSQLQGFLNSNYSLENFNQYLLDENGQYKWSALNLLGKLKVLRFATPILGGAVGVIYNLKLIDEVAIKADVFFSQARHYLNQHPDVNIGVLEAYHLQQALLLQASPLLSEKLVEEAPTEEIIQAQAVAAIEANENIVSVSLKAKPTDVEVEDKVVIEETIQQNIEQLAATHIQVEAEQSIPAEPQQIEAQEDLTKDLVELVKAHTAKTKPKQETKVIEKESDIAAENVAKDSSVEDSLVEDSAAEKTTEAVAASTATPSKPVAKRGRRKNVVKDDADPSE